MSPAAPLADAIVQAYATRTLIAPPSADAAFDLTAAYAVEGELARRRVADGHRVAGLKVGYANKAVWRVFKLDTLVWASMYDDTVTDAAGGEASLPIDRMIAPKIEPEIVVKLASAVPPGLADAAAVLAHVEWIALGFEIIDCPYPDWKFQPSDFVAAAGLHAALVVGTPLRVTPENAALLAEALPGFTVALEKDGAPVATGAGKNSLRSPALCVAELATALAARGAAPLEAGALISTGTLTDGQPIGPGQTWTAAAAGLDVGSLTLRTTTPPA